MWFLKIIGLGTAILPRVVALVQEEGGLWCLVAEAITGNTPELPAEEAKNFKSLRKYWTNWFAENGYVGVSLPGASVSMVGTYEPGYLGLQLRSLGTGA
jgi:hypothetical protein